MSLNLNLDKNSDDDNQKVKKMKLNHEHEKEAINLKKDNQDGSHSVALIDKLNSGLKDSRANLAADKTEILKDQNEQKNAICTKDSHQLYNPLDHIAKNQLDDQLNHTADETMLDALPNSIDKTIETYTDSAIDGSSTSHPIEGKISQPENGVEGREYTPLSTKPIAKIGFEANKKYETIYLAIQNEKKISKSQKNDSRNSVKFDKREPGSVKRIPKKKVALLLSYCGTGYNGMQINPNVASIELDLHKALAESGAVLQENAMNPGKNQFMRCARTDKGVHAGGQVVSLKMMFIPDVIEKINACLPDQIRAWGVAKVKNSFDAKDACSSRIYEYLLPTHCLDISRLQRHGNSEPVGLTGLMGQTIHSMTIPKPSNQEIQRNNEFRIDSETLDQFRNVLKCYEGTHNFHNFTAGKDFNDKSCRRYMISIEVSDPFIPLESDGEWVSIKIHGQSFMLHQIRKMIGLAILIIRSNTPANLITNAFEKDRINIPKAPALGLLLEKPLFDQYNNQIKMVKEKDQTLERDLIDFSPFEKDIAEFKQKWIYNAISREENELAVFGMWLAVIDACWSDYSWYLNQDGSLDHSKKPEELFKKGVQVKERADVILAAAENDLDFGEDIA